MSAAKYSPVDMIKALVAFDTTSRESNLDLIHFVEDYLAGHGVESTLVFNDDKSKANLVANIGPDTAQGGVVLSGHSDVVPVDGQDWSSDPFQVGDEPHRDIDGFDTEVRRTRVGFAPDDTGLKCTLTFMRIDDAHFRRLTDDHSARRQTRLG